MGAVNRLLASGLALLLLSGMQGCWARTGTDVPAGVQSQEPAPLPEVVRFGSVAAYPLERRIEVEASFCLEEGILEYLGVAEEGKTYESVLQLDCEPSKLHAALLALGYEPGDVPQEAKGDLVGDESYGKGRQNPRSYLDIFVEWTEGDQTVRVRAEELLISIADEKPADATHWVFTGSYFARDAQGRERYAADIERSIGKVKQSGGKSVLLLVEDGKGDTRFVAVPF